MTKTMHRVLVVVSGLALTAAGTLTTSPTQAQPASRSAHRLEATLRPSGDPDGTGEVHLTLNKARRTVCARVEWAHIQRPDAAHIHRASDGRIVVDLRGAVTGGSPCRTGVSRRLIANLLANPGRYYVNVHNPTYPAGAIQGRLRH